MTLRTMGAFAMRDGFAKIKYLLGFSPTALTEIWPEKPD
jgi:hypothetical protein